MKFGLNRGDMFRYLMLGLIFLSAVPGLARGATLRVDQVSVEGLRRVEKSTVLDVLQVHAGDQVGLESIDADIRAIFHLGRFQNVRAELDEQNGTRVLRYVVEERPLIRHLEFKGNKKFNEEKLTPATELHVPELFHPQKLTKAEEGIRKLYVQEGYYNVKVEPKVETDNQNEATLVFQIEEGDKVLVRSIEFDGNTVFSDHQLKKIMETKERWIFSWITGRGTYQEEILQNDLELMADQYFNQGYVQVKVRQPQVNLSEDRSSLDIRIEIDEGKQFVVGDLEMRGDLIRSKEELLRLTGIKSGDVFSRKQLRKAVLAVNDLYADQGYAYVNVSPLSKLQIEDRLIDLVFDIEQGVQVHIDRIRVSGNTRTRDKVIRREMKLVEGDLFSSSLVKDSRRRVKNLGFFEEVNLTTSKGADDEHMNLDLEVKEQPTGTFSIGFGYSSVDGLIGSGSVSQANFLGKGLKMNLAGTFGGTSTTYQVGLVEPYFLDKNLTLGFDLYKIRREWNDFSKKTLGGDLKLGFPITENSRTFFVYRYEDKDLFNVDDDASFLIREQEGSSTLSSIYVSLIRDTLDYRLDPSKGSTAEASIEYAGLGGSEKFAKYIADCRQFFRMPWGTVLSLHGQVGYIQEIGGETIPIDERFFLGGINSIRGIKTREVGPSVKIVKSFVDPLTGEKTTSDDTEFIGGSKEAYFNVEYIFPLIKDMGMKGLVFFDTGNAWGNGEEYFSKMRYTAGAGIRWFSPMGPLRLEWGYNLDREEGESPSQFEFSVGKFF